MQIGDFHLNIPRDQRRGLIPLPNNNMLAMDLGDGAPYSFFRDYQKCVIGHTPVLSVKKNAVSQRFQYLPHQDPAGAKDVITTQGDTKVGKLRNVLEVHGPKEFQNLPDALLAVVPRLKKI